jgi:hypothetical protein
MPTHRHPVTALDPEAMYPKSFTKTGRSKHHHRCKACFGRHDPRCWRCLELLHGAAPRGSFHEEYYAKRLGQLQRSFNF